jgi:aminoglycoside phosphotransferase (APT) family kinase protein
MQDELDELGGLLALMEPISPPLAAALRTRLDAITAAAGATEPMPYALVHGDFTPSQLLRDGDRCGLVDFDGVAQAEPALDLGQYVAYLRLAAAKAGAAAADDLVDAFVAAYAAGTDLDAAALRARVQVYACVSLLRTTVHAWQKLKPKRVGTVLPILLEEAACLPTVPS